MQPGEATVGHWSAMDSNRIFFLLEWVDGGRRFGAIRENLAAVTTKHLDYVAWHSKYSLSKAILPNTTNTTKRMVQLKCFYASVHSKPRNYNALFPYVLRSNTNRH
jgi:hypothetical protein